MNPIIVSALSILILLSCSHGINCQIINGGFEEWEEVEGYTKPVGWQAGYGFANYLYDGLIRDTISVEGDFSLKIVSSANFFSCETSFNYEGLIPTFEVGEWVSIFMNYKSTSTSSNTPDITYFEMLGSVFKSDSIVGVYHWFDTLEYEVFTEIEIPIEFSNPDSISMTIVGGAKSIPIGTAADICINSTHSWLDNINVAPSTMTVETEDFSFFNDREKVKIFPNPSTGDVTVEQEIANYKRLEVYDTYGRLILSKELNFPFDKIKYLEEGVYIIKLIGEKNHNREEKSMIEKIIIN